MKKRDIFTCKQFRKDIKKIKKQGKNLDIFKKALENIENYQDLDKKYKDHALVGNYKNTRECHLLPDLLLIYEISETSVTLRRIGSHSELFKK